MGVQSIDAEDDQFAYRYDTQLLIERRDEDLDEDDIADYITEHFEGNSLIASSERQRSRSDTERDRSSDHTRGILCRMAEGMGSRSSGRRDFQ